MRIAILGGTRFIGLAIVRELSAAGHDVVVMHRGVHDCALPANVRRVHLERRDVSAIRAATEGMDALVHTCAFDREDANAIVAALPSSARLIVLSSQDVYRAFYTVNHGGHALDAVPFDEKAPVREVRFPYRRQAGLKDVDAETYDKLDVEEVSLQRGAVVLRLPMVYGEHDPKRREEFVLRRIRAKRRRIPIGDGSWLWSRAYVGDVATAVRAVIERGVVNDVLNIAERQTWCIAEWARRIAIAADTDVEWIRVADHALPADLEITAMRTQHLLTDASRARALLDWSPGDPAEALVRSVRWHLANPPAEDSSQFDADDRALATL